MSLIVRPPPTHNAPSYQISDKSNYPRRIILGELQLDDASQSGPNYAKFCQDVSAQSVHMCGLMIQSSFTAWFTGGGLVYKGGGNFVPLIFESWRSDV